jgi:hypothetical protein
MKCSACGADNNDKQLNCNFCGASLNNSTNSISTSLVEKRADDAFGWFTDMVSDNKGSRCFKSKNAIFPFPLFHKDNEVLINLYYSENEVYFTLSLSVKGYYSDGNFNTLRIKVFENDTQLLILESNDIISVVESKISSGQWHLHYVTFKVKIDRYTLDSLIKLKNGKLILGDEKKAYDNLTSGKLFVNLSNCSNYFILIGSYNSFFKETVQFESVIKSFEEIQKAIYFEKKFLPEHIYNRIFETQYPSFINIQSMNFEELTEAFKNMKIEEFKKYTDENVERIQTIILNRSKQKDLDKNALDQNSATQKSNKKDTSCFIATATMGSYDHPVVVDLRLFRDNWLLKREWGVAFTNWYYTHGPKIAKMIEKSNILKKLSYILIIKPIYLIIRSIK